MENSSIRPDMGYSKSGQTPSGVEQLKIGGVIIYEVFHQKSEKREQKYGKVVNWSESGNVWIETPYGLIQRKIDEVRIPDEKPVPRE
jgi:hypothetical protein